MLVNDVSLNPTSSSLGRIRAAPSTILRTMLLLFTIFLLFVVRAQGFQPANREELKRSVEYWMRSPTRCRDEHGGLVIGDWDISLVKNLSFMFCADNEYCGCKDLCKKYASFNEPLHKWDTRGVLDMHAMFRGARKFNQNISSWVRASPSSKRPFRMALYCMA